jgi:hypothetical protein
MKTIRLLLLASVTLTLANCTHEHYYYRTTQTKKTYSAPSAPARTTPGYAIGLPNPGAPSSFRAVGN